MDGGGVLSDFVVWKQRVGPGHNELILPMGSTVLSIGLDGEGEPAVWFSCSPGRPSASFEVIVTATGEPVPDDGRFIGTFSPRVGLIFHGWAR